jgi:hypothetical protein
MSWDNNIRDTPEKWGLEVFAEFELEKGYYSFNTVCVWRDPKSNKFYWAHDSGCSCQTPFESFEAVSDLCELNSVGAFKEAVNALRDWDPENRAYYAQALQECCSKLRAAGVAN